MKSLLPPEAYTDRGWFEREREMLLKPLWQFIGLKSMLRQPDAFIAREVSGVPVVVQNFDGELRAFENRCVHRHSPLQTQAFGTRPLVCRYHGWRYGVDGRPTHIPFEAEIYRYGGAERESLGLAPVALEVVGHLVFVKLRDDDSASISIADQFGPARLLELEQLSLAFDDETLMAVFPAKFNWKLAYENLRDANHPRFVHARTLNRLVAFEVPMDEAAIARAGFHDQASDKVSHGDSDATSRAGGDAPAESWPARLQRFTGGGRAAPMERMPHYAWHAHVERYGSEDCYYNWLVFPNLHLASGSGGYSFIIEHHVPVAADRTDLHVYYVTAKKKAPYMASAAVLHGHLLGAEQVLREDIDVMEQVQAGLQSGMQPAHLGAYEYMSADIERWMLDMMEGRHGS